MEPDGTTRIVEYIADDHGFRAVVKKIGTPIQPEVKPEVQLVQPTPIYQSYDGYADNYKVLTPALQEQPLLETTPYEKVVELPAQNEEYQQTYVQPVEKYEPYVRDVYTPYAEGVYQQPKEIYSSPQIISTTYHGFTGNSDDDSAYTRYDNNGYEGYQGVVTVVVTYKVQDNPYLIISL